MNASQKSGWSKTTRRGDFGQTGGQNTTTVSNSIEATLLQHALDMEGINSFITNEHTSTMLPHLYGMLGHGIQIMVRDID